MSGGEGREADEEEAAADEGESDHGVPIPGAVLPPERRADARLDMPRPGPLSFPEVFGRDGARRVVDLGCGNGRFIIISALARPDHDHVGVDLVPQAIAHAVRRAGERGLANARFVRGDAEELLFEHLAERSVDEVHVYHPQPYYDPGKIERRLLTPAFFLRAWDVLRRGGRLVLQTDNPYYWRYIRSAAPRLFAWRERRSPWSDAPEGRTRREIVARAKGLRVFRGFGIKLNYSPAKARAIAGGLPAPSFDANRPGFR